MEEEKLVKCEYCGRKVSEDNLSRDGECSWCRTKDKSSDMTVGDLNSK
jgi:DNA-directed RNA polymerase subunit RPC12/RpoP